MSKPLLSTFPHAAAPSPTHRKLSRVVLGLQNFQDQLTTLVHQLNHSSNSADAFSTFAKAMERMFPSLCHTRCTPSSHTELRNLPLPHILVPHTFPSIFLPGDSLLVTMHGVLHEREHSAAYVAVVCARGTSNVGKLCRSALPVCAQLCHGQ